MVALIHLDTHVVVWLYAGLVDRFPRRAAELLEKERLLISPMVLLEMQYLFETGRVGEPAHVALAELGRLLGLELASSSFVEAVHAACRIGWTRDPFDRLIAGHATADGVLLLTADRIIRANLSLAIWDS